MANAHQCDRCKKLYLRPNRKSYKEGDFVAWLSFNGPVNGRQEPDICDECALALAKGYVSQLETILKGI